jgi:hypothetical protein
VTPRRERLVQPETAMSESRLAAILAADIAGYGALIGADEAHGARPQKPSGSRASDGW